MGMDPYETIWIAGASGRIGRTLTNYLSSKASHKFTVLTTDREIDVSDLSAVADFASRNRPSIVVNCAGVSRKDQAEENPIEAYRVNTLGARNLAIASESIGATIVHLSTDDLFYTDGNAAINEFDEAKPSSVYGKSKYAGERFVRELNPRHVIIRSSWVYTDIPEDPLMQALADAKRGIPTEVASNQFSSPTSALSIVRFIGIILDAEEYGVFHAACEGICSRAEFMRRTFEFAGLDPKLVHEVQAHHPYHIELENLMLEITGLYTFPNWEDELKRFVHESHLEA